MFTKFFRHARAHNSGVGGGIWPKFELIQDFMHVLENEVDPIKNEGARVFTRFFHYTSMRIFRDAQGQLTPQSLVRSGQISNSSEMLYMSLLPASIKKIRSKMKELECSQDFSHYNPLGAIGCHRNQSSNPIWPKTFCSLSTNYCYTQYIKALDLMVSEKKIFLRFPNVSLREMMTPGRG